MRSRGSMYSLPAGARKSLVLLWTAVLLCSLMLQYVVAAAPPPVIAANGLLADTVQGFEIDGDPKNGNASLNPGGIPLAYINNPPMTDGQDWNGVIDGEDGDDFFFRDAVDGPNNIAGDTTPDTSAYGGGNKETDTRDWVYYNSAGPNGKTDYRHVMAHTKVVGGDGYVYVGADRAVNTGSMVVDFELNRLQAKTWADDVVKPHRSVGDVLISLEYANGGSNPIVTVYRITEVTNYPNGQVATFAAANAQDTAAATRSATNWEVLAGATFPNGATYDVDAFNFAEATVNLSALDLDLDCLSFQQGSIRSRTGGAPDASQLKDASDMFPLDLNTCGSLKIRKVDAVTNDLVAGATFKIEPDPTVGSDKASLTVVDGGQNDPDGEANGVIHFSACEPGEYTVTEIAAPPGYFLPADVDAVDTILPGGSATFTFEDPLAVIRWQKVDASGAKLGGATFTITPNPRTGDGSLTVVDNTGQADYSGSDNDADPGEFAVRRVKIGGPYTIAETTPPDGYIGTSVTYDVTIPADMEAPHVFVVPAGTFVNSLGSIRWVKNGPDGATLLGGATFSVSPDPRDGTGTLSVTDNDANDADKDNGEFRIADARTGTYTVTETAAPTGYILDAAPAQVTVSANAPDPQIAAGTFVNHLGKIRWVKYGPDGETLLGGATFSVSPNPATGTGSITVADCVSVPCTGADKDDTPGEFELQAVPTGTYTIVETAAPLGFVLDDTELTAEVTSTLKSPYMVDAGSVTNTRGSISWVKNGPDGTSLLGGATFTITPNPQTGTGSLVVVDNDANDAAKTDGEFKVTSVLVDKGAYSIAETAAPAGYAGDDTVFDVTPTTASPDVTVPAGTWINTLGSLAWEKRDGEGALLGGATFQVTGPGSFDLTVVDNDVNDADTDAGQFKLVGLFLGGYTVTETVAPAGYVRDTTPRNATLTAANRDAEITIDFVNTLGSLAWLKHDAAGNLLGGATFHVTGPFGYDVSVTDNSAPDADPAAGKFLLEDLKLGSYTVTETAAPTGYILDPGAQQATLTQEDPSASIETPFVNTLGELLWTKDKGDQAGTLLGGATFSVTPNPFTGTGSLTVADNDSSDQDKDDGELRLVNVRVGTYTIAETAAPEGYELDETACQVTVNAANPTGTPACSFSNPPIPPAIDIVKTAGKTESNQVADGGTLEVEALPLNVTYKYVVTNTGDVRLVEVTVTDDNGTPDNLDDDFDPTCYDGETALEPHFSLLAGDSVTCYALRSITSDTTNIAVAAGESVGEGTEVTDKDDAKVVIVGPAINIVKTAGGSAGSQVADGATYETESFADNVTYAYLVTNTGTTELQAISLTDDKLGTITCPATTLAVGVSMTCYATASVAVDTINLGVVKGESPAGTDVEDSDTAEVVILAPSISVVKTAGTSQVDQVADGTPLYTNGGEVTYKYVVTNTGEVDLTGVTLTDDKLGTITCPATTLAVGVSMTCYATATVGVDTTNVATAEGSTPHETVDDTDDAVVLVRHASITKTNDATGTQAPGATVAYELTLSVVNGPIPSLTVTDELPDNFGNPGNISDGGVFDSVSNTITWTLANVADGETLTYSVQIATTTQGGDYVNTATITDGPCVTGCTDDSTVPVWRVSILKDNDASAPLLEGDDVVYTLTFDVQNGPIDSMTVTDTLPAEVENPRDFTVAPASVVGQVITWNLTDVADGDTITYTATIADGTAAGSYTNVAEITEGPCVAGECDDDSTVDVVTPDLAITKVADEDPILAGHTAGFTITVTNNGDGAAKDVVIEDLALPAGLPWAADNQACAIIGSSMTCQVGRLEPGATFSVHLAAPTSVEACGLLENTATVAASNEPTGVLEDNSATDTITVQCASIGLVKTAGNAADDAELLLTKPGSVIFTYVVTNTGTADLMDISLVDDNATPANTADDITVICPSLTLAAGASMTCTATLPVTYGLRTNIAVVTAVPVLEPEGEVSATDDAVVRVPQPEVTPRPTPKLTPPPTSSLDTTETPTSAGTGLLLVLLSLAGSMLAIGYLIPSPARSRRRNRRG